MWAVLWHPEAEEELMQLPRDDRLALDYAVGKLAAVGPALPYPHQSAVKAGHGHGNCAPGAGGATGVRCTTAEVTRS